MMSMSERLSSSMDISKEENLSSGCQLAYLKKMYN